MTVTSDPNFDTANSRFVGVKGDTIIILGRDQMPKWEALVFAAWLVSLADDYDEFPTILKMVQNK